MFKKKKKEEEWMEEEKKNTIPVKNLKEDRITVSQLEKKPFFLYGVVFIAFLFVLALFPFLKHEKKDLKEPPVVPPVVEDTPSVNQEGSMVCIKNQSSEYLVSDSTIVFYYVNNQLKSVNTNHTYTIQSDLEASLEELDKIKLQDQHMDTILKEEVGYQSSISETSATYVFDYTIDLSKLNMIDINKNLPIDDRIDFPYSYKQSITTAKQGLVSEGYVCY